MATGFQPSAFQNSAFQIVVLRKFAWIDATRDAPVVAHSLMESLVKQYGQARGRFVYFAMEREQKGPFAPGNEYDTAERPPQPIAVVKSVRPSLYGPPPPPVPRVVDDKLKDWVRDAMRKTRD